MIFKIGPTAYRVKITDDPIIDDRGKEKAGLCEWATQTIWIAGEKRLPLRRRKTVMLHEARHGWRMELGIVVDDESDADDVAAFTDDIMSQFERQGGVAALMRLCPDGVLDHTGGDPETPGEPRAAQCPRCAGLLNMPIKTAAPEFDPAQQRLVAWRSADCDFCGHTVSWRETVTSKGAPTGQVLGEPACA